MKEGQRLLKHSSSLIFHNRGCNLAMTTVSSHRFFFMSYTRVGIRQILGVHAATGKDGVCFYFFEKFSIFQKNKNKPFLEFYAEITSSKNCQSASLSGSSAFKVNRSPVVGCVKVNSAACK